MAAWQRAVSLFVSNLDTISIAMITTMLRLFAFLILSFEISDVWRQRDAEVVAENIQAGGVSGGVVVYHGGMDSTARAKAQSRVRRPLLFVS